MKNRNGKNKIEGAVRGGILTGISFLTAMLISGCGETMPDLSNEQINLVGEYAANVLLKYDSHHRGRLMSEEEIEKEMARRAAWEVKIPSAEDPETSKKPSETSKPSEPGQEAGEKPPVEYGKLEDFYDFTDEVGIEYTGYDVCTSYLEGLDDTSLALDAAPGKKILVLKFLLKNNSDALQQIDMLRRNDSYRVTVNGDFSRTPLPTLFLDNDLSTFQGALMPGASQETVLLIEIDQGTQISSLTIRLKNEEKESTILLLSAG